MNYRLLLLLLLPFLGQAQKLAMEFKPGQIIEEYTPEKSGIHRELPAGYSERILEEARNRASRKVQSTLAANATTQVVVTYDTPPPADVKLVFDKAALVWANALKSDVPIQIFVQWRSLASGVLGSAGASTNVRNFVGANRLNTWYPIALAEKMAHKNLNGTDTDVVATFNSDFSDWYIGVDGVPKLNQIDLYSVVLHEFGHGLGFIGQVGLNDDNTEGGYGFPGIFDQYMVNAEGLALMDTVLFKNPSTSLKAQVTTNALFLTSPTVLRTNSGERAKLYAPRTFSDGSSIYHVDQATYKVGDLNALMTPQIARGEITHDIGPIVSGAFADFGWYSSNIIGEQYNDTENTATDIVFSAKVYSDTLWNESSLKLMVAINKSITLATAVPLTKTGSNTFLYTLPKTTGTSKVAYYWMANELSGKKFTTPAEAPLIAGTRFGSYFEFTIGADTVKPVVIYSNPLKYIFTSQTTVALPTLLASDNIGISAVFMEYSINGGAFIKQDFNKLAGTSFSYTNAFKFSEGQLKSGDQIRYRVVVNDAAKVTNSRIFPASGYYTFEVLGIQPTIKSYSQTFDSSPSADFYLKGFTIGQAVGFPTIALQTAHPYADGTEESYNGAGGTDMYTNSDAILLKPVTVKKDTTTIVFDEIVLVEPGDAGEPFLNSDRTVNRSFYDYVIVQASKDQGKTWFNLENGWDSNANASWLAIWNSSVDANGNSTATATSSLVKTRTLNILTSGVFAVGDNILIRFRLHADVGAHGWGWAIDNLRIQAPKIDPILATEPLFGLLKISPNPTDGQIHLEGALQANEKQVTVRMTDVLGRQVYHRVIDVDGVVLDTRLDVRYLKQGTYIIQVQAGDRVMNQRLVIFGSQAF